LLDLGGAFRTGDAEAQTGTLPYLAPERIRGAPPTPAADMFGLGIVLYELATGNHPFSPDDEHRADASAWLDALSGAGESLASDVVPTLSPLLDYALGALLSPIEGERPNAETLLSLLEQGESGSRWKERLSSGPIRRGRSSNRNRLPFVGRQEELGQLKAVYRQVLQGAQGSLMWLSGESGSGKTRLVEEFATEERAGPTPPLYLYGRCSPFGGGRPGHPVRSLLRRWLHLPSPKPTGARERAQLNEWVDPATAETLRLVLDQQHNEQAPSAEPLALAEWLAQLAKRRALVVFLDDVTFAGEESLRVIGLVADRLEGAELTFICGLQLGAEASCPAALESLQTRLDLQTPVPRLHLPPLDEAQVTEWVEGVFHSSAPRQRLARVLFERSEGSPGALREIHQAMLEKKQVRRHFSGDGLELLVPPAEVPRSLGIRQLITDRFEALDSEHQVWLQRLAVMGGTIEEAFLRLAFPASSSGQISGILAELTREGWLTPSGARYRFARPALRESIYRTLPAPELRRLHGAAADALMMLPSGGIGIQRAFHLHAAGEHESLLEIVPALLRRARRAGRAGREHTLAKWALDAVDQVEKHEDSSSLKREFLEAACSAALRLGRRRDLERWLDELTDLDLDPLTHPGEVGRIYCLHGRHALYTGRFGLARGLLRNAQELLGQALDFDSQAEALVLLAEAQFEVGELDESRILAQKSHKLTRSAPIQARCTLCLARLALLGDKIEEALTLANRAILKLRPHARQTVARGILVRGHLARARIYSVAGRRRRALGAMALARRGVQQLSDHHLAAAVNGVYGSLLLKDNRIGEAETTLREARLACQESGNRPGELRANLHLAVLLLERGSPEASSLLRQAALASSELGQHRFQALSHALLARALRQLGDSAPGGETDRHSGLAIECMARGVELPDRIVIVATRALVMQQSGRADEGARLLTALRKRLERVTAAIGDPTLRRRQRRASRELLLTASSPEGPIYPRSRSLGPNPT